MTPLQFSYSDRSPQFLGIAERFERCLRRRYAPPEERPLRIALGPDARHPGLSSVPRDEIPTLGVHLKQGAVFIGPLQRKGGAGCLRCLRYWAATTGFDRGPAELGPVLDLEWAAGTVEEFCSEFTQTGTISSLEGRMVSVDARTQERTFHPVFGLRDCPFCRSAPPRDAEGLRVHCSSQTGIVRRMAATSNTIAGLYHAIAEHVMPLPADGVNRLLKARCSYGRGFTRREAEESAIGEAIERYSTAYRGTEPLIRACIGETGGVDPRDILLYSGAQYDHREAWNAQADERYFVPARFDPAVPIGWFPGVELGTGKPAWLPAACCLMWYEFGEGEPEYAFADSIGCASGRTGAEALTRALLEWVERDAISIWWYNRLRRPAIDLKSFEDPRLDAVREALARMERTLTILNVTTDIGVPSYVAIDALEDGSEPFFGAAASFSPREAAFKAASEAAQIWFATKYHEGDSEVRAWVSRATVAEHPWLAGDTVVEAAPEPAPLDAAERVAACVAALRRVGLRSYAVDLSRPDTVLKTVRAVVPGLRHVWRRNAPGRLYDVPVQLGWLEKPLTESGLNSICCML